MVVKVENFGRESKGNCGDDDNNNEEHDPEDGECSFVLVVGVDPQKTGLGKEYVGGTGLERVEEDCSSFWLFA